MLFTSISQLCLLLLSQISQLTASLPQHSLMSALYKPQQPHSTSGSLTKKISSHILDIASGKPGIGVKCQLFFLLKQDQCEREWKKIAEIETDQKGRVDNAHPGWDLRPEEYFARHNRETFFPYVEVVFVIVDLTQHYHVPLTLSNYGYSTYRGQ